ncbi:hypothetical protein TCAL_15526 [Tigriopus californicus]|uniref:Protein kinase domain-containing protein n=1 Tax=Tigriopus californicus TaxID=6832 RepID=A0A553PTL3_TIGCA|nr:AP2-associated protein kinase 1-like [Tigriopus californicus]TRY81023.1 hypothetical protein TCAL_15526 [Tigriopus californicus]
MKKIFSRGAKPTHTELLGGGGPPGPGGGASGALSGASHAPALPASGGWTVGRHSVVYEDLIAEGGFGVVFLVKAKGSTNTKMALKRMFVNNDKDLAVCKREINIVSNLNGHPNLIGYVDSSLSLLDGEVHEILLLMPYHKTTLLQLMNDKLSTGFKESEVLAVFCDICSAVARLHHCQTPIIHRDLKVENVLRSDQGRYVLCDFGSATAQVLKPSVQGIIPVEEEIKRYTTLSYRAPEMIDLYSEVPLTARTDIWALGCLLYKVCYFSLPFGESALAIQAGNLTFPSQPKYSSEMKKLIRYLLTVKVERRPDIFQVSHLAFELAGQTNPVQNLHNSSIPTFGTLSESLGSPLASDTANGIASPPSSHPLLTSGAKSAAAVNPVGQLTTATKESLSLKSPGSPEAVTFRRPIEPSSPANTSVAPRQRPRGQGQTKNLVPGMAGPLPLPPTADASSQNPFVPSTTTPVKSSNPFASNFDLSSSANSGSHSMLHSSSSNVGQPQGPVSLQEPNNNPFVRHPPSGKGWNPFEDSKSFGDLSEDALFGAQFDQLRQESAATQDGSLTKGSRDPFLSAPFTVHQKNSA